MKLADLNLDGTELTMTIKASKAETKILRDAVAAIDPDWIYYVRVSADGKKVTLTLEQKGERA